MSKYWISALITVVVIIGGIFYLISSRSYPVAVVNFSSIGYASFKKDTAAATRYYAKALETYNKGQANLVNAPDVRREIEKAVLDRLIENNLIDKELRKIMKSSDIENIINNKIEQATAGVDISKEVETLYGLTIADFKENVLKPQARRDALEGRFILENKNMSDWLKEARTKARVLILIPNFSWNGEEVIVKK